MSGTAATLAVGVWALMIGLVVVAAGAALLWAGALFGRWGVRVGGVVLVLAGSVGVVRPDLVAGWLVGVLP